MYITVSLLVLQTTGDYLLPVSYMILHHISIIVSVPKSSISLNVSESVG